MPTAHFLAVIVGCSYAEKGSAARPITRKELLRYCVGAACPEGKRIAWVEPIPTGRNSEYISVMTRRITPPE